ncbi:MAG: hypothetical protein ACJ746_28665 [Bryobacteraceae bacterium]
MAGAFADGAALKFLRDAGPFVLTGAWKNGGSVRIRAMFAKECWNATKAFAPRAD